MRRRLTQKHVVGAALELLCAKGFDGLGMRPLAERLGIQAPSLYNHVRDKAELLGLLADAICAEVPPVDPSLPWRTQLQEIAQRLRKVLLARRDAAYVLAATPPVGFNRLRLVEQVLLALRKAGLRPARVVDAASSLNSYVVGFTLDEAQGNGDRSRTTNPFVALSKHDFPTLVALAKPLKEAPAERRFTFGLDAMLDGIQQLVK